MAKAVFLRQNGRALQRRPHALPAVAALILTAYAAGMAQSAQTPQPATSPPKPLVPAATSSIVSNPEAFYGQFVTVMAAVDRVVSPYAFTIDQDRTGSNVQDVLVLTPVLTAPPEINAYVTVMGEVVRFSPADADALPSDIASRFRGRPAIRATSVLTAAMVDLARRPLAPLTPEEAAFDRIMKHVGPSFASLRQGIAESNAQGVTLQANILKMGFAETEKFWRGRQRADAQQWAGEARTHAETLERAAASARWDDAKAAATLLQQSCSSCHAVYRERLTDGSYRIRGEK
jgi:cytochrome c551/c552